MERAVTRLQQAARPAGKSGGDWKRFRNAGRPQAAWPIVNDVLGMRHGAP